MTRQQARARYIELINKYWTEKRNLSDEYVGLFRIYIEDREQFKHECIVPLMSQEWQDEWVIAHEEEFDDRIMEMHAHLDKLIDDMELEIANEMLQAVQQ